MSDDKEGGIVRGLIIGGACGAVLGILCGCRRKRRAAKDKASEVYEGIRDKLDEVVFEKKRWWQFWK